MGNQSYISFNRAISEIKFSDMLSSIVDEHYSKCYQTSISYDDFWGPCWSIEPKEGVLSPKDGHSEYWSIYIFRAMDYSSREKKWYKGKFEHKHMGPLWGYWFADQIHGHLSKKFGATSSDDGVPGHWKIDPGACPTPMAWAKKRHPGSFDEYSDNYRLQLVDEIPPGLRTLSG